MKYKNHLIQKHVLQDRLPFYTVQGDLLCQSFSSKDQAIEALDKRIQTVVKGLDSIKYGMKQIPFYQHQEKDGLIHRCRFGGRFHFGNVKAAGFSEYLGTMTFEEALVVMSVYAAGV